MLLHYRLIKTINKLITLISETQITKTLKKRRIPQIIIERQNKANTVLELNISSREFFIRVDGLSQQLLKLS